ncbi:hypothetical protein [Klebsiella pneumoniae]|uniref:hypothetical protein n=1 Tax=Klebsiella pneumoniae TaxID=573 RepID=UPI00218AC99F|nr:hypothetical protein [Klebsiella pneumoniae]URU21522.1 hypothetical protein NBY42_28395 [Klebsiella pneumoniae]
MDGGISNKSVQGSIIELDAYAVLANGDPSQLERSSNDSFFIGLKRLKPKILTFVGATSGAGSARLVFHTRLC